MHPLVFLSLKSEKYGESPGYKWGKPYSQAPSSCSLVHAISVWKSWMNFSFFFLSSQSRTDDKLFRFKKAVEYYSAASKPPQSSPYIGKFLHIIADFFLLVFTVIFDLCLFEQDMSRSCSRLADVFSSLLWQAVSVCMGCLPVPGLSEMPKNFPTSPRPCVHFGMAAMLCAYKWAFSEKVLAWELLLWKNLFSYSMKSFNRLFQKVLIEDLFERVIRP